ncbi:hypothetical protein AALO_G00184340 [Alosa alosa]|uniref:Uncharacterized protein n=1 Tax=Alosa alosa TaxID=278164 RepID=A0AAV6G9K9_9TELE|nr:hypothetical protein AALO_G00184340 [Alosa alosa]
MCPYLSYHATAHGLKDLNRNFIEEKLFIH